MGQAIAGVAPPELAEVTIMSVWPSMAATPIGRMLGKLYMIRSGVGNVFTLGKFIALVTIPIALVIYLVRILPWRCIRYRLTNRRLLIERGVRGDLVQGISLDDFDAIDVAVLDGQEWYPAGELIFRKGPIETFRLSGVRRPETFRQVCLKAQRSVTLVRRAMAW